MKRAFISFDFDEDQTLKHFFAGQFKLPDSSFEAADWSMKEAAPQSNWLQEAARRINRSDIVIVLVGENTYRAPGVLKEVAIACNLNKPIIQVIGYRDAQPTPVRNAGRLVRWSWKNIESILNSH